MRRIFIALITGGLLLASGVAASAKLDSSSSQKAQHGQQQQDQAQNDEKTAPKPAPKPAGEPETTPATAAKAATAETKPATTAANHATTSQAQCGFQGEQTGEHDDAACNDQKDRAGVNEPKTESNDKADLPEKDNGQQGNNQD